MSIKSKGILYDFIIEFISGIVLFILLYQFGRTFPGFPRIIYALFFLLVLIPLYWGNLILSHLGKNTIGQRIAKNKSNK